MLHILKAELIDDYVKRLVKDFGLKELGSGIAGTVFQHPTMPNVVVKVHTTDSLYTRYMKWCLTKQSNVYVPRIYQKFHLPQEKEFGPKWVYRSGPINLVFMEKLLPATKNDLLKFLTKVINPVLAKEKEEFKPEFKGRILDMPPAFWRIVARNSEDKDLAAVAAFLGTLKDTDVDMHNGNIMKRGNQLVVIDPASRA